MRRIVEYLTLMHIESGQDFHPHQRVDGIATQADGRNRG